ncbi:MAG TPA: glycosyl hydrolase family 28-related protein, partial [Candidatus Dormibacteraeota bacterium]|nr:glycosyl hydrolase family 28-related protein [Candidatus Dormibacteraeota bacterium]
MRAAATAAPLLLWRGLVGSAAAQGVQRAARSVRDHGATGDGRTLDTRAIQAAIDAAATSRGTVYFPPGTYRSGTVRLRSR